MQLPAALTFVLDGVLMGAHDFRDLRWQTTIAFVAVLPIFGAVLASPSLGIVPGWLGMPVWICARALKNHSRVQGVACTNTTAATPKFLPPLYGLTRKIPIKHHPGSATP